MKNFIFSLLIVFSCDLTSQTIDKQLQSNLWFAKGWFEKEGVILKPKTYDKSDWQAKFYPW